MSKKMLIISSIIILLIIIGLPLVFGNHTYTKDYIGQVNKYLDIEGIKLSDNYDDVQNILKQKLTFKPGGFGCEVYEDKKDGIYIVFSSIPGKTEYGLTTIETDNSKYSLYDIHVGDNRYKPFEILKKNGFKIQNKLDDKNFNMYKKGNIHVSFDFNKDDKIDKISIRLEYKTNIMY